MEQLAKSIIAVMKEVDGIDKNTTVGTGKSSYQGLKDADVKKVFKEAMAKHGLCILPLDIDETVQTETWKEQTQYGEKLKRSVFTKVTCRYLLLHESGESQVLTGYGHGIDTADKGAGKATTYALKNLLMYTFLTPSGNIDDTDTDHSNDHQPPPANSTKQTTTANKPWLNETNVEQWTNACSIMQQGGTIADVRKIYSVNKRDAEKLINQNK